MLHGWGGVAEELLTNYSQTRNILDHMIQDGLMRPMIVVSPTWDKDDQPKGFGESVEEIAVFHNEFINELVPAVELKYATYLKSAGEADIEAFHISLCHQAGTGCQSFLTLRERLCVSGCHSQ